MNWLMSIKDIKRAQENNQLVVFVGAGVSKNSNVPTWWELIKTIAEKIKYTKCDTCNCRDKDKTCPDDSCENRYAFTQEEFLRIPEYFYQQHKAEGDETYYDLIHETLRGGSGPNAIDDEIFNLLPHHIITTNYDSLLEDSLSVNSQLYAVVSQDSDLLSKANDRYLIKMHGDLEKKDTIVLKESDYIDYEQKHPLISTFIRSLLVNHTFVFLGYSLNDYNLNLIIGWINYFRKMHGIENRPVNYLIDTKPATDLEKSRLEDKKIYVVNLNSLPADVENLFAIPDTLTDPIGRKLFTYLKCISSPMVEQKYLPLEDRLLEKYEVLAPYSKISYYDLISVHPLGRTTFMGTELVFYEREWYEQISTILKNPESLVTKTFCRAGISAIHLYEDDSSEPVPNAYKPIDKTLQLYFDNNYIELEKELTDNSKPIQQLYFYHLIGHDQAAINNILTAISEECPARNYVEIILQKTRARCARLSFFDRQEEETRELQQLFDTTPEKWRKATAFLRMLFESAAKNIHIMEKLLEKHEKRYEYRSNTIYSGHAHLSLWELQAYAYDYLFFFIENGLPLHYFSNPKEYFCNYLKSILCTYSPIQEASRDSLFGARSKQPHYVLNEIDLDMMIKYTDPKSLKAWLKEYSVQELEIEREIDIVQKFTNFCLSIAHYKQQYWFNPLHSFSILICLLKLDKHQKELILKALCNLIEVALVENPVIISEIFETIEYLILHLNIDVSENLHSRIIKVITSANVFALLLERCANGLERVLKKISNYVSNTTTTTIIREINTIENPNEKCKKMYLLRFLLPLDYCKEFFNENLEKLSTEEIFYLIVEKRIDYTIQCWSRFIERIAKGYSERKQNPGVRCFPDWLAITIEHSIILRLFGFDVDLQQLSPYADYSEHLQFILDPKHFDYSLVDTSHYMWQNLIYSKEYRHFFIEHKECLLSEELRNLFNMGVETTDQSKIVYGILLQEDELRDF